jgi:hypothetical protein
MGLIRFLGALLLAGGLFLGLAGLLILVYWGFAEGQVWISILACLTLMFWYRLTMTGRKHGNPEDFKDIGF